MLAQRNTTRPVTDAIAAMREPHRDAAIDRLLTGYTAPTVQPLSEPFGQNRADLRSVSIAGLISLFKAHAAASDAFTHEGDTPRALSCQACSKMLEAASEAHDFAKEEIVTELETRVAHGSWERDYRRMLLVQWYALREDWSAVRRYAAEAAEPAVA